MAFAVTIITSGSSTAVPTTPLTVPVGGVPLNSLIVFFTSDASNAASSGGSIADTGGNSYTNQANASHNNVQSSGFCAIWWAKAATALVSGDSITYTKAVANTSNRSIALYVTGQDLTTPVDTSACASAFGSSITPSVTSGTPSQSNPLYFGGFSDSVVGGTLTQPGGWTNDINTLAATRFYALAHIVGTGTTPQTYNPSLSATKAWAEVILVINPPIASGGTVIYNLSALGVG